MLFTPLPWPIVWAAMVWIVALAGLWAAGCLLILALTSVASRSDRPSPDDIARLRRSAFWLPPRSDD